MSDSISPGWYKDPADPDTQRYWDGEGWLGDPLPADADPPSGPPAPSPKRDAAPAGVQSTRSPGAGQAPPLGPPGPLPWPTPYAGEGAPGIPSGPGIPPGPGIPSGPGVPSGPGASSGARLPGAFPPGTIPPGWRYGHPAGIAVAAPRPHGLTLASPGVRLVARLIDIAAVLLLNVLANGFFVYRWVQNVAPYVAEMQRRWLNGQSTSDLTLPDQAAVLELVILGVAAAVWFAYEVPAIANSGQTLGKRLMHIRVMRLESDQAVGFGRAFRRWNTLGMPTLLWACCGIGFLMQFLDCLWVPIDRPLHQAWHDKSAMTVVVHNPPKDSHDPTA